MTREQGTRKRFWVTLLFVAYVGFFPFTYLSFVNYKISGSTQSNYQVFVTGYSKSIN
ncbi:hypothetical protein PN451_18180 [Dolichospermum planctonicum CS-1226]|uniref:Sugar ABC transporter permease n=1 Tax=Dolichospermum planctonicum CS-1226 TaxID=3021751 RepID=A0ABT5AK94_9CYAN|nr:hypothetical protein [Dolichospermum planctonicum CS-1226]